VLFNVVTAVIDGESQYAVRRSGFVREGLRGRRSGMIAAFAEVRMSALAE
jgi:hypothetical protein